MYLKIKLYHVKNRLRIDRLMKIAMNIGLMIVFDCCNKGMSCNILGEGY